MQHAPLIIDVAGTELQPHERRRLRDPLVGGVVLFARNFVSRAQLVALCASLKALRADLLITVDHEGGRVQRFRSDGFTPLPPMAALGRLWQRDAMRAVQCAAACGHVLGAELRACGIDLSFAPVLDLDWGRSQVIGERALHADARVVALLAQALIAGMQGAGLAHCAKHFPGHGWAFADSHVAAPSDARGLRALRAADEAPYGWLRHVLRAVMPAHVVYRRVDAMPAGFSTRWLRDELREHLGFTGAIFSDDLNMQAARALVADDAERVARALIAGCDLALLCNLSPVDDGVALDRVLQRLHAMPQVGDDAASEARRRALLAQSPPLDWDTLMHDTSYRAALDDLI